MKRILSLILGAALISVLILPVTVRAENNTGGWIELLETATVNDSGNNLVPVLAGSSSQIFEIDTPSDMYVRKVDIIIGHGSGHAPSSVKLRYNNTFYTLTLHKIDATTTRAYGENIPQALYAYLVLQINRSQTTAKTTYQILSCRVTSLLNTSAECTAFFEELNTKVDVPYVGTFTDNSEGYSTSPWQFKVGVRDWQKFDSVTIVGSMQGAALNSVRANIAGLGLPYEMSYTSSNSTGSEGEYMDWDEWKYYDSLDQYAGTTEGDVFMSDLYLGKTLFRVTIDLTGVDRDSIDTLDCWFTCLRSAGYPVTIQIVGVTGSVSIADTTEVTWWNRFRAFMTNLFGSDKGQESLDDLQQSSSSISQGASDIHAFEQSQQAVLDSGMTTIQNAVSYTSFMAALVFVQKYANMTFDGISQYAIVFTLPLFLGLFFFLCSRIPGITRWKPRPPKSKGGDSP